MSKNNLWLSKIMKTQPASQNSVSAFGEVSVAQFKPQTGWIFAYNLNAAIVSKTELFGGSVVHEGSFAKLETGTAVNGVAFIRSNRSLTYSPGIGAIARFTAVFDTPVADSLQLIGVGNNSDGWFFGYNGLKFGIMKRRAGIDEWFYQEDWTESDFKELVPQNGNVYQIKYQWLGFGMQYFGIENDEGNIENVHRIKYSNKNIITSVENPSLPLAAGVSNNGNTTNVTLKTPSAVAGLEGEPFSPVFESLIAYEREVTIGIGETYLFGLQNPDTWLGKDNRLYVFPKLFSAATDGNKSVTFRVYFNPTITTPVWQDIEPNISPLQYDEDGTWVPNGEAKVFTLPLAKIDGRTVDLSIIDAEVQPEQIFAITAQSSGLSDVTVGITFKSRT